MRPGELATSEVACADSDSYSVADIKSVACGITTADREGGDHTSGTAVVSHFKLKGAVADSAGA